MRLTPEILRELEVRTNKSTRTKYSHINDADFKSLSVEDQNRVIDLTKRINDFLMYGHAPAEEK